jgi:acetyl esterase/lipase
MKTYKILPILVLILVSGPLVVRAQEQPVPIWPGLAPGSENKEDKELWTEKKDVSQVYQPDLTIFLPEQAQGPFPAIVVCPGGGYRKLVMEKEGYKVARWLNDNGVAAFVLKYRLDREEALRDAQRAVSLLRKDAEKYGIDGSKIGVMGFSAGAHLAANLAANYQDRIIYDEVDELSSRPDFWVPVYGGFGNTFKGAKKSDDIPPAFIVHAANDSKVPVEGSVEMYLDLKKLGIPAELHVYEQGEHGFALEENRGPAVTSTVKDWSARLLEWLKVREIL